MHEQANFEFEGKLTAGFAKPSMTNQPQDSQIIYINSLWVDSLMGGSGDYTAILFAAPAAGTGYSGQLSVSGNGTALENASESVTFSLTPFNDADYQKSGGMLLDKFAYMGTIRTAGGDYILLLDGEQAVLEAAGKGICFYGGLRSDSESAFLQNEAEKTGEILSYLCRQKSGGPVDYSQFKGLDPNNPKDMEKLTGLSEQMEEQYGSENGVPAWYPDGLIPAVNFSGDDGYLTNPAPDEQFFKLYDTQYYENEDVEDLIQPYRTALSGYDNYQEYISDETGEAIFLFTMGRYSLQVLLQQTSLKLTGVAVEIY
jgi:hypothetical protein